MVAAMVLAWVVHMQPEPSTYSSVSIPVRTDHSTTQNHVSVRLASGAEYDSNSFRSVSGPATTITSTRRNQIVGDGVQRTVLTLNGRLGLSQSGAHQISGRLLVGAKQFWRLTSEDLLAQDLSLRLQSHLSRHFHATVDTRGHISRIRNGQRNYNLGRAEARLSWVNAPFNISISGGFTGFEFLPETNFNYLGLSAKLAAGWWISHATTLDIHIQHRRRFYPSRLVLVPPSETSGQTQALVFCDELPQDLTIPSCDTSPSREDREYIAGVGFKYRGPFLASVRYQIALQRSNSALENVDRHRVDGSLSFVLPGQLTFTGRGSLQINNGFTPTDQQFLAEDDENQNTLQVQIQRPLDRIVRIEVRYALYMNQFGTSNAEFQRHAIYLGLALHARADQ
ncbi:MAG: hypothetical protein KTR25_10115 [Myxococcales bacterium]|nr:hypothetical protein [Myxococcales bacterium]